jgi:hypothetical protein
MLKMLLRPVDLKELRNTQDFLDKRATNNQAAHSFLASPWALLTSFSTPRKNKENAQTQINEPPNPEYLRPFKRQRTEKPT